MDLLQTAYMAVIEKNVHRTCTIHRCRLIQICRNILKNTSYLKHGKWNTNPDIYYNYHHCASIVFDQNGIAFSMMPAFNNSVFTIPFSD